MRFENQTFADTTVTLDYNEFVNCRFERCILVYAGGYFVVADCKLDTVRFSFHEAAQRTLAYLKWVRSLENGQNILHELLETAPTPRPMKLN